MEIAQKEGIIHINPELDYLNVKYANAIQNTTQEEVLLPVDLYQYIAVCETSFIMRIYDTLITEAELIPDKQNGEQYDLLCPVETNLFSYETEVSRIYVSNVASARWETSWRHILGLIWKFLYEHEAAGSYAANWVKAIAHNIVRLD
ncbi:hypothetical protein FGO68_gene2143 [Halteria grandinella]|uniref:Uncharacterized protein n=1 Tax=Halteria grandinella TaxID=5974 RepID=A0A8J8NCJ6_HALGN|nr:hypothetical protein FGO68_gene2143 [Halteria grandinella]